MIMDATQPLSDAFDMIRKAFSPTVNANKMFFFLLNYHELLLMITVISCQLRSAIRTFD